MIYRKIVYPYGIACLLLLFAAAFPEPVAAISSHFETPSVSPSHCDYLGTSFKIEGEDAQPGDEVAFFDPDGILCGVSVVEKAGIYGIVHVYGDDPTTPDKDEGARAGDTLTIRIWDKSEGVELGGSDLELVPGDPPTGSSFVTAPIPLVWEGLKGFVLNIHVPPGASDPQPGIKANYTKGPLSVVAGSPVSISISLDPGAKAGQNADWWVAVHTPFAHPLDWYSYVHPSGWQPGIHLGAQAPLFEMSSPFEILNMKLPMGEYTFYFAVDDNADGEPNTTWYDSVLVDVR